MKWKGHTIAVTCYRVFFSPWKITSRRKGRVWVRLSSKRASRNAEGARTPLQASCNRREERLQTLAKHHPPPQKQTEITGFSNSTYLCALYGSGCFWGLLLHNAPLPKGIKLLRYLLEKIYVFSKVIWVDGGMVISFLRALHSRNNLPLPSARTHELSVRVFTKPFPNINGIALFQTPLPSIMSAEFSSARAICII